MIYEFSIGIVKHPHIIKKLSKFQSHSISSLQVEFILHQELICFFEVFLTVFYL